MAKEAVRNGNSITVFLLLSLAAMNLPQTAVLCLGGDGHVAIEPAGHDHCADGSHLYEYGPGGVRLHNHSHVGRPQCLPCIDIPNSVEANDNRRARQELRLAPVRPADSQLETTVRSAADTPGVFEPALFLLFPSHDASSRCVVLQV